MSKYIVMYYSNGMLYMFYINDSNEDEVYHIASSRYNEFIFKETFLNASQYARDRNYIYEDMMNDFYNTYDLPSK